MINTTNYEPISLWAEKNRLNRQTVNRWARRGRITGAIRIGRAWVVPTGTEPPPKGQAGNPRWIANKGAAARRRELEALQDEPANAW
jgi:hypothetical protein